MYSTDNCMKFPQNTLSWSAKFGSWEPLIEWEIRAHLPLLEVLLLFKTLSHFSGWNQTTLTSLCRKWRGNGRWDCGTKASVTVCRGDTFGPSKFEFQEKLAWGQGVREVFTRLNGRMGERSGWAKGHHTRVRGNHSNNWGGRQKSCLNFLKGS